MIKIITEKKYTFFILIYSFVIKFFNSLASPLFDFSSFQIDNSTFYMVGKALLKGNILYKDIFDHKAPYIYLINAIASLIDYKHIGLYIVESISLFIILLFIYKIILLFSKRNVLCFIITIPIFGILFTSTIITYGMAKTEMYSIMFFIIASYILLSREVEGIDFSSKDMFLVGIFAGLSFMINIKQVLMYMSIAIVLLIESIIKRNFSILIKYLIFGLLGVFVSIAPYAVYMFITNSMKDMYYALFVVNTAYLNSETRSYLDAVYELFTKYIWFSMSLVVSIILVMFSKTKHSIRIFTVLQFVFAFIIVIMAKRIYSYYFVSLLVTFIGITIIIINLIDKYLNANVLSKIINTSNKLIIKVSSIKFKKTISCILTILILVLSILLSFTFGNYRIVKHANIATTYSNEFKKVFRNIGLNDNTIKKYRFLATGMSQDSYYMIGVEPSFKFFFAPALYYQDNNVAFNEQYKYIINALADFVIFRRDMYYNSQPMIRKNNIIKVLDSYYSYIGEVPALVYNMDSYKIFIKNELIS